MQEFDCRSFIAEESLIAGWRFGSLRLSHLPAQTCRSLSLFKSIFYLICVFLGQLAGASSILLLLLSSLTGLQALLVSLGGFSLLGSLQAQYDCQKTTSEDKWCREHFYRLPPVLCMLSRTAKLPFSRWRFKKFKIFAEIS